jgi:predicted ATPase/DNA-binding winged helix-turn-helix (wHTH) protein
LVDAAAREEVTFGPFTLSPGERRLARDGIDVALAGRALDILIALVARASEPLSKRELMEQVWPDATVGEASLRFHVANLRKALGDGEDDARYIATLSGRGYCFVAPISRATPPRAEVVSRIGNLPSRPPLIGRDDEIADLVDLLGGERLVTIVGAGGVGKTRLAIAAGRHVADAYLDGVWLVELAPLSDPSLVVSAVATALDLARGARELSTAFLASTLRDRRLLLILDNCEHLVVSAAALADALIEGIPGLTVLATSQESLRLDAERVYRLDPLTLPPPDAVDITGYGAVDLFAHRARAADRRFDLNESNVAAVADICRRLDGVPLSLEMAAARVPSLGLKGLRASLEARLHVLSGGLRTPDVRHQTLRSTVEWSVGLLDETEALVFRSLGVFAGSFSLDAAMAVVAAGEMNRWTVADAVARLVDKSVVVVERDQAARYRLLETLRLYARDLLRASGAWETMAESHARHFCRVFEPARDAWETTPDPEWQSIYMPELDNLRSALDWALADPARFDLAVELIASAGFAWYEWGLVEEGWRISARVVERLDDRPPSVSAAAILRDAGDHLSFSAAYDDAHRLLERSAAISRQIGDELGLAKTNVILANLQMIAGRPHSEVVASMKGVREAILASGHKRSIAGAMDGLGVIAHHEQNFAVAVGNLSLAAELARQLKNVRREQSARNNLALVEFSRGDVERAIQLGQESVSRCRPLPHRSLLEEALENLAIFLVAADRLSEARPVAEEALSLQRGRGVSVRLLRNLQLWALIAALEGQGPDGARLIGWVDAAYERMDVPRDLWETQNFERLLSLLRARLPETDLTALAAESAAWGVDGVVNFTFERIVAAGRRPAQRREQG